MEDYEISCIVHDDNGVITQVGVKGSATQSVPIIARLINDGTYSFYTYKNGIRANVYARKSINGSDFLTTSPDSTLVNNLDFLPSCTYQ